MSLLPNAFTKIRESFKYRSDSIKFRIIFWFVAIGSLPAIGIAVYAIQNQSGALESEAFISQKQLLTQKLNDIEADFSEIRVDLQEISARFTLHKLIESNWVGNEIDPRNSWLHTVKEDFTRFLAIRKRYNQIQLINLSGQEIVNLGYKQEKVQVPPKEKLQNVSDQPYFIGAMDLFENDVLVDPVLTHNSEFRKDLPKDPIIRFGQALYSMDGEKVGVLILTVAADHFLQPFGDNLNGKIMLVNKSGDFLYHPDEEIRNNPGDSRNSQKFEDYYPTISHVEMLRAGQGMIEDHKSDLISYGTLVYRSGEKTHTWLGVYSRNREAVLASVGEFQNRFAFIILLSISLVFIVALVFGARLTRPLLKAVTAAESIASGNLTIEKLECDSKDEVGILSRSFDGMLSMLQNNIHSIVNVAQDVTGSSAELSGAVQDQSAITAQQSTSLTQISATLEELSSSSSQIANNSNSVVDTSAAALKQSEIGMTSIEDIKQKMDQIAEDNKISTVEIVELGKKSKEIGKVMEIITNIADQTKLIAFNAAIEASSAGQAGKRFEVVAVEIRRLADNVMNSTEDIETIVAEIQQAIHKLVFTSEKGAKRIKEGTDIAAKALNQLESLVDGAKSTNDASTQISLSTQQQKSATNQVLDALKEIEQGFMEIALSIKGTSSISDRLSDSSSHLDNLVKDFKTTHS